jgi:hypothetical protein
MRRRLIAITAVCATSVAAVIATAGTPCFNGRSSWHYRSTRCAIGHRAGSSGFHRRRIRHAQSDVSMAIEH